MREPKLIELFVRYEMYGVCVSVYMIICIDYDVDVNRSLRKTADDRWRTEQETNEAAANNAYYYSRLIRLYGP